LIATFFDIRSIMSQMKLNLLNEIIAIMVPDLGSIVDELGEDNFEVQKFRGLTFINPTLGDILHMNPVSAISATCPTYIEDDLYATWTTSCNADTFMDCLNKVNNGKYDKFLRFVYYKKAIDSFSMIIEGLKNIEINVDTIVYD
jgi:hypothetical protein